MLFARISRKKEWVSIRVKITNEEWWWEGQPPYYWYVQDLSLGQESYNTFGEKVAEIVNIENFDSGGPRRMIFIEMKLAAFFNKKKKVYMYNYQPLEIGGPIDLSFGKNNIRGLITYIGSEEIPYVEKEIEIKMFALYPWVAESYKTGLEMKDSLGRVLAQIEGVQIQAAEDYEFYDLKNRRFVIKGIDERRKDVTLRLKIKTFNHNGVSYFIDGAAIKIGEVIWFHFPEATTKEAIISKIFE